MSEPRLITTKLLVLVELEKKPMSTTELSSKLRVPQTTVYTALKELRLLGLVEFNKETKTYSITEKGKHELESIRRLVGA